MGIWMAFAVACTDDESSEVVLYPDHEVYFTLYPNDMAQNDSAASNLAHGVALQVHPGASYELSFDADPDFDRPRLQLFRIYGDERSGYRYRQVRSLEPAVSNGRYIYSFLCEESDRNYWVTTLEQGDSYYAGRVRNVTLTGAGAYSDHMSLNLIVVGEVESDLHDFTLEELSQTLLFQYRKHYSSITIDTLYVNRAETHPTLGAKYPADGPWLAGYSSDDMMLSELGGWPGISNALDIVLVHYINTEGVLGYSDLFSGNMGGGDFSTVVLGTHVKVSDFTETPLGLDEIVETALHETGHFFGLRHTTATNTDMETIGDYSNVEDGLDDTPYCDRLMRSGLLKRQGRGAVTDFRVNRPLFRAVEKANSFDAAMCPDAGYFMFPLTVENKDLKFSEQQLEIIRKNLMIFPH